MRKISELKIFVLSILVKHTEKRIVMFPVVYLNSKKNELVEANCAQLFIVY